jgi:hypothetical protein
VICIGDHSIIVSVFVIVDVGIVVGGAAAG